MEIYHKRPIFIRMRGNSHSELFFNITKFILNLKFILVLNITKPSPVSFKCVKI